MNRHFTGYLFTGLFLFYLVYTGSGQSLDQILEKHFQAVGMQYLCKVRTIQYKGYYVNHFLERMGKNLPEKLLKPTFILSVEKRKAYRLQIFSEPGELSTGFYEGNYWILQNGNITDNWNPGKPDRRIILQELDPEGFLYDWKNKKYQAELQGITRLNGKNHYKIRLTIPQKDTLRMFIDVKTNLISFISYDGDLSDGKKHASVEFQNFKKIESINLPFKRIHTELMLDGSYGEKDILISEVLLDPDFDKDFFKPLNKKH